MGQAVDGIEIAGVIGQDAGFLKFSHWHAEGAAAFAVPGFRVDPVVLEGSFSQVAQFGGETLEVAVEESLAVFYGIVSGAVANGGVQVAPAQFRKAEFFRLAYEVAPEKREGAFHGVPKGGEGLVVQAGDPEALLQGGGVAPGFGHGVGASFDAVQAGGHLVLDFLPGIFLGLLGVETDVGIAVGLVGPEGRQGQFFRFALVGELRGGSRSYEALQLGPGLGAALLKPGGQLLFIFAEKMGSVVSLFVKGELEIFEII